MAGVALYYDSLFLGHGTGNHPEKASRVSTVMQLLAASGMLPKLSQPPGRDATEEELLRVHRPQLIERVRYGSSVGPVMLDPDTVAAPGSYEAAIRAAGACIEATTAVAQGEYDAAFCLVRPPGHHATPSQSMGFCLFNSVAVAASHAREVLGIERIAIVDPDLHHGNGTQDTFYGDGNVLYVSTHQYPFYPMTGDWHESGVGAGHGTTLNLPLPTGCGDFEYSRLMDEVIAPKLRAFQPQLILVSAGYDAHFADSISGAAMRISCAGYASLMTKLRDLAAELCNGKIVLALEGGYNLTALAWSVRNSLEALMQLPISQDPLGLPPERHPRPDIDDVITSVKQLHGLG